MYIYNTTFAVDLPITEEWLKYMETTYIPALPQLKGIKLSRLVLEPQDGYASYSLLFYIDTDQDLSKWKERESDLLNALSTKFGDKVLFFSTLMDILLQV